ncbi:TrmH family RNA methyltransferase [Clostridium sp. C8-1-8]|uniref:TrmH family RNA methyltransferase n=1 Tax=Clostridium sp. C8-1-8 TaxID=2698831 RepID=UPI00136AAE51|nr:TrmH family RNA methyltransferase [Clostridium sp. C8-1-8]
MSVKVKKIYSENSDFQRIEVLKRNREKRNKYKEFFVEGVKSINYAIKNNWNIKSFVYSKEKPLSQWAKEILANSKAEIHFELSLKLMHKISEKDEDYSEIIAVVSMASNDLTNIKVNEDMVIAVFDRPSSHGNLGTIIRSCEALKVDALVITGHAVDLYDPKTIRSSMGTFFSVPTIRLESHNELIQWFKNIKDKLPNFKIVGSTAKSNKFVDEVDLTGPMALLIGNETYGLSKAYKDIADDLIKIPMYGEITSFNVACAASIILYEIDRQRRNIDYKR